MVLEEKVRRAKVQRLVELASHKINQPVSWLLEVVFIKERELYYERRKHNNFRRENTYFYSAISDTMKTYMRR